LTDQPATIVQRLWNYCNVLRDDGVSYGNGHTPDLRSAHQQTLHAQAESADPIRSR